jgi:hypothetical protein
LRGLVLMSVITASYGNTSCSLFDAKRERHIEWLDLWGDDYALTAAREQGSVLLTRALEGV